MYWHYQVRKRSDKGEVLFDVVETYSGGVGYTQNSIAPLSDTQQGLITVLEMMLRDCKKYPVLIEEEEL